MFGRDVLAVLARLDELEFRNNVLRRERDDALAERPTREGPTLGDLAASSPLSDTTLAYVRSELERSCHEERHPDVTRWEWLALLARLDAAEAEVARLRLGLDVAP